VSQDHQHPPRPSIGGQAVLEGVMMRGPKTWSVACRKPDESITIDHFPLPNYHERWAILRLPLLRGMLVLVESLLIGIRALMISANHAIDEEEEQLSDKQLAGTLFFAMAVFSGIFIVLPVFFTGLVESLLGTSFEENQPFLFNLIEGAIRLAMFVGYLAIIGTFKDVRRVFQYHGAEHKTIYAYENGDPLDAHAIDEKYPTLHVRCGTNFLFIVLFLTIISHFFMDLFITTALLPRIAIRLAAVPLLAGISYEAIKFASRNEGSKIFHALMIPGLALQKITTKPPTIDQIEVAIAAMQAVAVDIDDPAAAVAEQRDEETPEAPIS
jgi:uncharacterized protein YqhQ